MQRESLGSMRVVGRLASVNHKCGVIRATNALETDAGHRTYHFFKLVHLKCAISKHEARHLQATGITRQWQWCEMSLQSREKLLPPETAMRCPD